MIDAQCFFFFFLTTGGNAFDSALQLVSLCILTQGGFLNDLPVIEAVILEPALRNLYGSVSSGALEAVCAFTLTALRWMPAPLRLPLAPFILDPLFHANLDIGATQIQQCLLSLCRDFADRSMLHDIGCDRATHKGIILSVLSDDFMQCLVEVPRLVSDVRSLGPRDALTRELPAAHLEQDTEDIKHVEVVPLTEDGEELNVGKGHVLSSQSPGSVFAEETCSAVIRDIREQTFKIGPDGFQNGNPDILDRCLEKLSAELYSKETHFILELIQNADDNVLFMFACFSYIFACFFISCCCIMISFLFLFILIRNMANASKFHACVST